MRVLLDECVPIQLRRLLPGHEVSTVEYIGWRGLPDSELLSSAAGQFDVFLTCDVNIVRQQSLSGRGIAVVIFPSNRRRDVERAAQRIAAAIDGARVDAFTTVELLV